MQRLFHFPSRISLLTGAASTLLWLLLSNRLLHPAAADLLPAVPALSGLGAAPRPETAVAPAVLSYLENEFCDGDLCPSSSWAAWIILEPDSTWTVEELRTVREALIRTIAALDDAGFDGRALLRGYRFRHSRRLYLDGRRGILARVRHGPQEIVLSDGALLKQWGFYIYHELGHVADLRLLRALTVEFQRLTLGEEGVGSKRTARGFWLNKFARDRPEEATADAFALWVMLNHTANPQPVFWLKPDDVRYETIVEAMGGALQHVVQDDLR